MATFTYAGIQAGKKITGEISASDPKVAAAELRKKKLLLPQLKKVMGKPVKAQLHLMIFQ